MKRVWKLFFALLLFFMIAGCQKEKKEQEILPISREVFTYDVSEKTSAIAVDEFGNLYTARSEIPDLSGMEITAEEYLRWKESGEWDNLTMCRHTIEIYDTGGNRKEQREIRFGTGIIQYMTWYENQLYCVSMNDSITYLYLVDCETWEIEREICLSAYNRITNLVFLGDYLYLFGNGKEKKTYALHQDVVTYTYNGEKISRINLLEEEVQIQKMQVDFPIGMYATDKNTLMIYQYTEKKGFGFLEFDPEKLALTEQEWAHGKSARSLISSCGSGFLYRNGTLYYGTAEGVAIQLMEDFSFLYPAIYVKGFAFLLEDSNSGAVIRICTADLIKENKEIHILTDEYGNNMPFGCGYQMIAESQTSEKYALKVLAQDKDFDLYLLNTRKDFAYNLKKNGAFYALNEVEGVQEYLDACFPYMSKLAYNEDGDIWMIPVSVDIPVIVYNKEFCSEHGIDYADMDFMELLEFVEQCMIEEPEKISIGLGNLWEQLHTQYLETEDSFDTQIFRTYISRLKEMTPLYENWSYQLVYGDSIANDMPTEFYLDYNYTDSLLKILAKRESAVAAYGVAACPKISEEIGNVGSLTILAVNPNSSNLEETLEYITAYCNYMLTSKNSFLLAEKSSYDMDNSFIMERYQVVADGTIEFRLDSELYEDVFIDYIDGMIGLEDAIAEADRRVKIYKEE